MITTHDDDLLRSHDEVEHLLRYGLPGVRVRLDPVVLPGTAKAAQSTRRFVLSVDRVGSEPLEAADLYSLPCLAGPIFSRARALVEQWSPHTCAPGESVPTITP